MGVRNSADADYANNEAPQCGQQWLNGVEREINNLITSADLTATPASEDQQGIAAAIYAAGGDAYTDSGAADAYILTAIGSKKAPNAYFSGMRVRFIAIATNTGVAATINVATIGIANIVAASGAGNPPAGTIIAGEVNELSHDGTNFRVKAVSSVADATTSSKGIVELAVETEMENETSGGTLVVTPDQVKNSPGVAKVWVVLDIQGVFTVLNDYNASSVADDGTGLFTVNHGTNFSNVNYTYEGTGRELAHIMRPNGGTKTTGAMQIVVKNTGTTSIDVNDLSVTFHGDQ